MLHPPSTHSARISEIFSSLQGEGTHLGERHLFIRFEECHIHCCYCDEAGKPGEEMSLDTVLEEVRKLERDEGPHAFISLTGGEPLLYVNFLRPLLIHLKAEKFKIYLETAGILWKALEEVIGWCDVIAMDMKPTSVTHDANFEEEHRKFLALARERETFVKIVLSSEIDICEFERLVRILKETAPEVPLVLQPVSTRIEGHEDAVLMTLLQHLQRLSGRYGIQTRIVPRFHKIFNLR